MAAATVVTKPVTNIDGSYREKFVKLSIASNGDTYVTGLKRIRAASVDNPSITSVTFSGGTITFASGGAVSNFTLRVVGL